MMYEVISGTYFMEGQAYRSYGIRSGDVVIEDISLDRAYVAGLAEKFQRAELSVLHLRDAVMDAIARDSEI